MGGSNSCFICAPPFFPVAVIDILRSTPSYSIIANQLKITRHPINRPMASSGTTYCNNVNSTVAAPDISQYYSSDCFSAELSIYHCFFY